MNKSVSTDVLIIGGGLVGASLGIALASAGVGLLVEVGPRGVLTGLAHRCAPELRAVASYHPSTSFFESRARVRAAASAYGR